MDDLKDPIGFACGPSLGNDSELSRTNEGDPLGEVNRAYNQDSTNISRSWDLGIFRCILAI